MKLERCWGLVTFCNLIWIINCTNLKWLLKSVKKCAQNLVVRSTIIMAMISLIYFHINVMKIIFNYNL